MKKTSKSTVKFPSIAAVTTALRAVRDELKSEMSFSGTEESVDVRLQVQEAEWGTAGAGHVGSSDYDLDHRGFWGAASVDGRQSLALLRWAARDLIQQARDQEAMSR